MEGGAANRPDRQQPIGSLAAKRGFYIATFGLPPTFTFGEHRSEGGLF